MANLNYYFKESIIGPNKLDNKCKNKNRKFVHIFALRFGVLHRVIVRFRLSSSQPECFFQIHISSN